MGAAPVRRRSLTAFAAGLAAVALVVALTLWAVGTGEGTRPDDGATRRTTDAGDPRDAGDSPPRPADTVSDAGDPPRTQPPDASKAAGETILTVARRLAPPQQLRPGQVPETRAVLVAVEDPSDPSGIRIVGPFDVERTPGGTAQVRIPTAARVVRWWGRVGSNWYTGTQAPATSERDEQMSGVWGERVLVRVLDAVGRAATGVPVALSHADGAARSEWGRATTDELGVAFVGRPQQVSRFGEPPVEARTLTISVALPFVPPVTAPLPPRGEGPVVLRLPPSGALEVQVTGLDADKPGGAVSLSVADGRGPGPGFADSLLQAVDASGHARFPHLGLGVRFELAHFPTADRVTTRATIAGPTRAGATSVVRLAAGGTRPTITGRLLLPQGGPAAGKAVTISLAVRSAASPWTDSTTGGAAADGDGRFRTTLDVEASTIAGALLTVASGEQVILRRKLPPPGGDGVVDLGDVQMGWTDEGRPIPVLAAGNVVGDDGAPIEGALVMVGRTVDGTWTPRTDVRAATDAAGAFEIRAEAAEETGWEARVTYSPAGRRAAPVTFRPGDASLRLVAHVTASATVLVVLPRDLPAWFGPEIVIDGEPAQTESAWRGVMPGMLLGRGARFQGLAPGRGRLLARAPGHPSVVLVAREIEIEAGKDHDLGTLDLTRAVPTLTVTVVGADGKPAADGTVWWRPSRSETPGEQWRTTQCLADGTVVLPAMTPVDVLARSSGRGFAEAQAVTANATLRPPPAAAPVAVEAVLADGVDLPEVPFRLTAKLTWLSSSGSLAEAGPFGDMTDPRTPSVAEVPFDRTTRRARWTVLAPGRYVVTVTLWVDRGGSGGGQGLAPEPRVVVEVGADDRPREVTVRVSASEIERVKARLTRR